MKERQRERVLKYMQDFGSITQLEALEHLGVARLASRISDLKKDGYAIRREMIGKKNRYGELTTVARYSLEDMNNG